MTGAPSRDVILQTARRLFGERGYNGVTIREIAAEAGFSPALVMKVVGSKAELFATAAPMQPEPYNTELPVEQMGYELVRRILARRDSDAVEPWARALFLTYDAPDPATARHEFRERYLARLTGLLGDGPDVERRAGLLACLLMGLAGGVRTLRLLDSDDTDPELVVKDYGALAQALIDAGTL